MITYIVVWRWLLQFLEMLTFLYSLFCVFMVIVTYNFQYFGICSFLKLCIDFLHWIQNVFVFNFSICCVFFLLFMYLFQKGFYINASVYLHSNNLCFSYIARIVQSFLCLIFIHFFLQYLIASQLFENQG